MIPGAKQRAALVLLWCLLSPLQLRADQATNNTAVSLSPPEFDDGVLCFKHNETVNITGTKGLFKRAMKDDDLEPLYMASLLPDIAYWARMAQQRGHMFTVADVMEQLKRMLWSPYVGVIAVQDGVPYRFKSNDMPSFATLRILRLSAEIAKLHAAGRPVPNTLLIFNTEDVPICNRIHGCRAPVFSLFKRLPPVNSGHSGKVDLGSDDEHDFVDEEILLPNFNQDWDRLCFFPWEEKNNTAIMRASVQMTMTQDSTRVMLAQLSSSNKEAAELLDAGIVWNDSRSVNLTENEMRHFLGMRKHCRWRFLLNTDGHTASSRMGHLLGLNSVVLKEKSPWVEYYYRALEPGKDHLVFEPDNLLQLLKELRAPGKSKQLKHIATAGQQFAHRYLHNTAKALYTRQAIIQYNKLFKAIESFVSRLPLAKYQGAKRPTMSDLLSVLSDITGVQF